MTRTTRSKLHAAGWLLTVFCLVLAPGVPASGAANNVRIYVAQKFDKAAANYADWLLAKIRDAFKDQYPCASLTADTDLKVMLDWDRERSLITDTDNSAIYNAGTALGAKYIISLNVIAANGKISMYASCLNAVSIKPISKKSAIADEGDSALDSAESLAGEFVSDIVPGLPECIADDWSGTITYTQAIDEPSKTTEAWVEGNGTRTTDGEIVTSTEAKFDVHGTKRPATVSINATWQSSKTVVSKGTAECGGRTLGEQPKTVPWNETEVETVQAKARQDKLEANVSVVLSGNHYTISFIVPEVVGTMTGESTLTSSGRCGPPETKKNGPTTSEWRVNSDSWTFEGDTGDPDVIRGSKTVGTATIEYYLKFVHGPPAQQPKK
jgi:hypothetical protein